MTQAEIREIAAGAERSCSFEGFLREFVYIRDVHSGRELRWEWWPVHDQMLSDLEEAFLVVLKPRQVSWSWFTAAYAVWNVVHFKFFSVLVLSIGEDEAKEFLEKCRFIYQRLPEWLKLPLEINNTEQIKLMVRESWIKALPSTVDAGRGETASLVIVDEAAMHPYAAENFVAYKPTTGGGGQILMMSTANGFNFFQGMYQAGKEKQGAIRSRFYPWWVRPGRDAAWFEREVVVPYTAAGKADRIAVEYPSNDVEAFLLSGSPRFDQAAVRFGLENCRDPWEQGRLPERMQRIAGLKVWKLPRAGEAYVMGTDSAQGLGDGDYDCTVVLVARTLEHVATIHGKWEPDVFGQYSAELGVLYNNALWGIEHAPQGHGHTVIQVAKQMRYPRVYWQSREQTRAQMRAGLRAAEKVGWLTTVQTKGYMIDMLASAVATGQFTSYEQELWGEFRNYVRNARGGTEAQAGGHDDRVMAAAIARQMALQPGATAGVVREDALETGFSQGPGVRYSWNHRR